MPSISSVVGAVTDQIIPHEDWERIQASLRTLRWYPHRQARLLKGHGSSEEFHAIALDLGSSRAVRKVWHAICSDHEVDSFRAHLFEG